MSCKILFISGGDYGSSVLPMGVGYLSSILKVNGDEVDIINLACYENHLQANVIEQRLQTFFAKTNNRIVGLSAYTSDWAQISEIAKLIKRCNSEIKILAGGPLFTAQPELAMSDMTEVDVACIGEAEMLIVDLVKVAFDSEKLEKIPNLLIRKNGGLVFTAKDNDLFVKDLDTLPLPDYVGLEYKRGFDIAENIQKSCSVHHFYSRRYLYPQKRGVLLGARGCPYNCTFCDNITSKKYRQRSLKSIIAEIDYQIEYFGLTAFEINDDLFANKKERLLEFCELMKKRNASWTIQLRVDSIDEEIVIALRNGNIDFLSFGIESFDDIILQSMNKKITAKQIEWALILCQKHGIRVFGNIIIGDVEETLTTAYNSLVWLSNNPQFNIYPNFIMHVPNSKVYLDACNKNIIRDKIQHNKQLFPIINNTKMSDYEFSLIRKLVSYLQMGLLLPNAIEAKMFNDANALWVTTTCPHCQQCKTFTIATPLLEGSVIIPLTCSICYGQFKTSMCDVIGDFYSQQYVTYKRKKLHKLTKKTKAVLQTIENIINNRASLKTFIKKCIYAIKRTLKMLKQKK